MFTERQELGVQAPVGYWDPAGLAKDGDAEVFKRRRCRMRDDMVEKSTTGTSPKSIKRGWDCDGFMM